jgi:tRNA(fMet)-specific endonuclease VapC
MGFLIDAGVFIDIERAGGDVAALLGRYAQDQVAIAPITAAELLHGVHRADSEARRLKRSNFVEGILATLPIIPYTLDVARHHARIWAQLEQRGETIGPHDYLLAATCLATGDAVVTTNEREFQRVPGLVVENWLRPTS